MTWKSKTLALLISVMLGMGLAACGSGSDSDQTEQPANSAGADLSTTGDQGSTTGQGSSNPADLVGTKWTLMNVGSTEGTTTSLPNTIEAPTLEFKDGQVQVFGGCNSGSGTAEVKTTKIDFGPIAMTKKSCGGAADRTEAFVNQVLQGVVPYQLSGGSLVLFKKPDLLVFSAG